MEGAEPKNETRTHRKEETREYSDGGGEPGTRVPRVRRREAQARRDKEQHSCKLLPSACLGLPECYFI